MPGTALKVPMMSRIHASMLLAVLALLSTAATAPAYTPNPDTAHNRTDNTFGTQVFQGAKPGAEISRDPQTGDTTWTIKSNPEVETDPGRTETIIGPVEVYPVVEPDWPPKPKPRPRPRPRD